jgi:phosphonate transport system permease protein
MPLPKLSEAALPSSDHSRSLFPILFGICFAAAFVGSWQLAQIQPGLLFEAEGRRNMARFITGMFPPDLSLNFLRFLVVPFFETIQISVMGTVLAIAIGFPLSLLGTASLAHAGILHELEIADSPFRRFPRALPYLLARGVLSIFRCIPEFVWAFMFVRAVGLGPFPGVLALGLHTGGVLGKLFAEVVEDIETQPLEALHAAGASRLQIFFYGVLPRVLPQFLAYSLYRWEVNIREAIILGYVGAGGLGQQIQIAISLFLESKLLTLILAIYLMVTLVDYLSASLRRRLL